MRTRWPLRHKKAKTAAMTATQIPIMTKSFTFLCEMRSAITIESGPAGSCRCVLHHHLSLNLFSSGGEGGIRTPVGGKAEAVFKTAAIDHSATSPAGWQGVRDSNPQPTVLETATLPIELTPYCRRVTQGSATVDSALPHSPIFLSGDDFADAPCANRAPAFANRKPLALFHGHRRNHIHFH
jgi:hypothetical protein